MSLVRRSKPYPLSKKGQERLSDLHPALQSIVNEYLYYKDLTITCSFRSREEQEDACKRGCSKAHYGQSPHNFLPARAVDIIPYPVPMKGNCWDDNSPEWDIQAELFLKIAKEKGIEITWGGTFKKLVDKPHFELKNWRIM